MRRILSWVKWFCRSWGGVSFFARIGGKRHADSHQGAHARDEARRPELGKLPFSIAIHGRISSSTWLSERLEYARPCPEVRVRPLSPLVVFAPMCTTGRSASQPMAQVAAKSPTCTWPDRRRRSIDLRTAKQQLEPSHQLAGAKADAAADDNVAHEVLFGDNQCD